MLDDFFRMNAQSAELLFREAIDSFQSWKAERMSARDIACMQKIRGRLPHTERLAGFFATGWNEVLERDADLLLKEMIFLADDLVLAYGSRPSHESMNEFLWGEARLKDPLSRTVARDFLALNEDLYWINRLTDQLSDRRVREVASDRVLTIWRRIGIDSMANAIPYPFDKRWQ